MSSYFTDKVKSRSCLYCGDIFEAKEKSGSRTWQEYCPKCVRNKVWYGRRDRHEATDPAQKETNESD